MNMVSKLFGSAAFFVLASSSTLTAEPVENIVLIHGAFVDGNIWNNVTARLLDEGYNVRAVQLPLTSHDDDVKATEAVLDQMEGPVILVGYSWGGVPATVAGMDPDVVGLVYFAAVTPEPGETLTSMLQPYGDIELAGPGELEFNKDTGTYWIKPEGLHNALAYDAPSSLARLMGAAQKPTSAQIFTDAPAVAAWQTKPSWYAIATEDRIFPVPLQRALAEKIGATTVEWPTSHAAILSRPGSSADLIAEAAQTLSENIESPEVK